MVNLKNQQLLYTSMIKLNYETLFKKKNTQKKRFSKKRGDKE